MNVSFFDKNIRRLFVKILSIVSTALSIIFSIVSCLEINKKYIWIITIMSSYVVFLVLIYFFIYWRARRMDSVELKINNSKINIKFGNINDSNDGITVINFNEYFDTVVDDKIINVNSLNGEFIREKIKNLQFFLHIMSLV